jgi:hypothetical protein
LHKIKIMENQIEEYNRMIAKFMGYKYVQENIYLDDSDLSTSEQVVTVYSKVPIDVTYEEEYESYFFKQLPNPDFGKEKYFCHWANDIEALCWSTVNWREYVTKLDYHYNWRSLMEVVEKIESFKHPVYISCNNCTIYEKGGKEHGWMVDKYALNKIDAVYEAVVECIMYTPYWRVNNKDNDGYTFDDEYAELEDLFKSMKVIEDKPIINLDKINSIDLPEGVNEIVDEHFFDLITNSKNTITDGETTWSAYCSYCGAKAMQVVRPGKIQCSNCG